MTGIIQNLFRKPSSDERLVGETKLELVANQGVRGDKSFGKRKRQVLLVEEEILHEYELKPGDLRENIVTSNLRLSQLEIGTQLKIGDVILEVTGDYAPCSYIEELQVGDQIEILITEI